MSKNGQRGGVPNSAAPYVRAGNFIFVSGQLSLDAQGNVIGEDIATQTRNVFDAIKHHLAQAGASMADIVKHNVYYDCGHADEARFLREMNRVRFEYFSSPGPTTTEIRTGLTVEGALIAVEAIAAIGVEKEPLMPPGHWNWAEPSPFCQGWKVGDLIFCGGQRSLDGDGYLLGSGDIEIQTDNAFRNFETIFKEAGGDRSSILRQNTYYRFLGEGHDVTDYWEKMTRVRMRYWASPSACGTGVRVRGLPDPDELIQVEGMGTLSMEKQRLMPADHWDWSIPGNTFTQGWRMGNLVFVGGQISADANARAVGGDMASQTRNVLQFVRNTLHEAGASERDVVKVNSYYCADGGWDDIEATNQTVAEVLGEFYPGPGPAMTNLRVTGFAFEELLIEIEAIAVLDR
jgi:enamine deaminase RidA (YjgF/YER057c/UK114 family)